MDFNDKVKKGQLLARIDPTLQHQAVAEGQAALDRADAQLAQAKAEFDRNKQLYDAQVITATEFTTIQVTYRLAQSNVRSAQLNQREGGSVGVSLSVPLFDRGSAKVASQQATINVANARSASDRPRQTVALEVRRAFLDYQSALDQLSTARAQRRTADLALSATQERYRVGAATLTEVSVARAAQVSAASALVNARYTLIFQQSLMAYYTGALDPTTVSFGGN